MNEIWILMNQNNILYKVIWTTIGLVITIILIKTIKRVLYSKIKAKGHIKAWIPQGKILREIEDANSQITFY